MKLIISKSDVVTDRFIIYLRKRIVTELSFCIYDTHIKLFETYINTNKIFNVDIDIRYLLRTFISTLYIKQTKESYILEFNTNICYPTTDISLFSIVKFITYGNKEINGYPFILETFKRINNNIEQYYNLYTMMTKWVDI